MRLHRYYHFASKVVNAAEISALRGYRCGDFYEFIGILQLIAEASLGD